MKNREELIDQVNNDIGEYDADDPTYIAVDGAVYAVLEYIDDAAEKYGHLPGVEPVLRALRSNVAQLGRLSGE